MKKLLYTPILCLGLLNSANFCLETEIEINLLNYEARCFSQYGEDGVLQKIFDTIGTTNKYYIEFGAGDGHWISNTKYLRERCGWKGLLLEGGHEDIPELNLHKEFITAENICDLFEKYDVPTEFDVISIDVDGNDFYLWKALCDKYKPRVVVIEFNSCFWPDEDRVQKYDPLYQWKEATRFFGSSILALFNLGRKLGYSLIYKESTGSNLFFIRDDILESTKANFKNINHVFKIYYSTTPYAYHLPFNPNNIEFVTSASILN